jgi:hypothetical protein
MPSKNEPEETEKQDKPTAQPRAPERKQETPSLEGLVKMKRDGRIIHAHPTTVPDHVRNSWKEI